MEQRKKNKMGLIIKSNIRPRVKELDKENSISSVAEEVETALERKVEDILVEGIKRAKANGRRTLQSRDL
jgi:histone H3/H4